ncbi:hypothetical protein H2248_009818 [Termitomyces sp. 'cryptogamus']|nr:hypothetical protein H2248_009818 [Termitomyces sp. 'cryptogamus']
MDRAKMIDRELTVQYVTTRIAERLKTDLFVIWSEDNSEKLIIHCRVIGGKDDEDDKIEEGVQRVFLMEQKKVVISPDGRKELRSVIEFDSSYVIYRHLALLLR